MRKASIYELSKVPPNPRYVFICETNEGLHTIKTYMGVKNLVDRIELDCVLTDDYKEMSPRFCMVDYLKGELYNIPAKSMGKILRLWKDNYLDPEWDVKEAEVIN